MDTCTQSVSVFNKNSPSQLNEYTEHIYYPLSHSFSLSFISIYTPTTSSLPHSLTHLRENNNQMSRFIFGGDCGAWSLLSVDCIIAQLADISIPSTLLERSSTHFGLSPGVFFHQLKSLKKIYRVQVTFKFHFSQSSSLARNVRLPFPCCSTIPNPLSERVIIKFFRHTRQHTAKLPKVMPRSLSLSVPSWLLLAA